MIKFLLDRPIAVLMAFTACFIIGLTTYFTLPVSLLPDIAIPEITVQAVGTETSARELENTVMKPIRQQLMQVSRLRDIRSETRDGGGIIRLSFDFGTNTDLAFIEVNEKIDAAMNYLPRETERPRVIKASATDIPVFCLNLTLAGEGGEADFLALSEFAEMVIKRRIEQLPEVAMVDITGTATQQVQIRPDIKWMETADITLSDLEEAISASNIEPGSMTVRDGYYEYNIRFSTLLRTAEDVENIYIRKGERLFQLKDMARVAVTPVKETGVSLSNGKRAVTLAVIKQADENMDAMKESLQEVVDYFSAVYPEIEFSITRNQTQLLDFTISNLKQNLSLGFIFICIVAILFLGDVKSPAIIGLSMIVSLVVCFLFFYLFHVSLNIISLAGLILALGMMVDSSIVVTENIAQYRAMGYSLDESCARGTNEVLTPMLSSTFTTIVVFVPLVFLSGIAGAIFRDQAFAVTVGLIVSYFTGIMLLPVLYKMVKGAGSRKSVTEKSSAGGLWERFYDAGIRLVFRHKVSSLLLLLASMPLCVLLFYEIPKSRMPDIEQNELIALIEWNENIHIDENRARVDALFREMKEKGIEYTAYVGSQQFLLNRDRDRSLSEAELYFKAPEPSDIPPLEEKIRAWLQTYYPASVFSFAPPETVFEKLFVTGEADIVAGLYPRNRTETPTPTRIHQLETKIKESTALVPTGVAFDNQYNITIDLRKLLLYNVDYSDVYRTLRMTFRDNEAGTLRSYQQYIPIVIAGDAQSIDEMMRNTMVKAVPLASLVSITPGEDLKTITAGKNGEYIPFQFYDVRDAAKLMDDVRNSVRYASAATGQEGALGAEAEIKSDWDVEFSGSFFSNRQMLNELVVILLISILLMYFILAAQFESFLQPLIVLLEIPIDVAAALLLLSLCGHTLNLMSAIGIVVTCSIIINDSILKLDAINVLRKAGMPLLEAIHEAGRRRLRPIVMTSLTSILAMVPLLFSFDMGSELQKPLSLAMIAAMSVGTLVSLFIIPLVYWFIYKKEQ
ncbi:MAG: efflux RND transporter permease subunit [Tannerellaceae bacterium]|jgi:multidrug efflux pump subunit AcrB|nr:efflux RND transporter permease subunit [Tannerellaceae bacterium]